MPQCMMISRPISITFVTRSASSLLISHMAWISSAILSSEPILQSETKRCFHSTTFSVRAMLAKCPVWRTTRWNPMLTVDNLAVKFVASLDTNGTVTSVLASKPRISVVVSRGYPLATSHYTSVLSTDTPVRWRRLVSRGSSDEDGPTRVRTLILVAKLAICNLG